MAEFLIYQGTGVPDDRVDRIRQLPAPPPWRAFEGGPLTPLDRDAPADRRPPYLRAVSYRPDADTVTLVNVALHLRRPLLVTGDPGIGKSTLAYAVAHELRLGQVLRWPIASRSVLDAGLYHYDAVGRVEEASIARQTREPDAGAGADDAGDDPEGTGAGAEDIGRFIRLGPLGTALAPYELPRVLLIDEIDKGDVDLPNDLLDVFEEGEYRIPELMRIADASTRVRVRPDGGGPPVTVTGGLVRCNAFPLVVMTSNGEREFPPAFLRRCVQLELRRPGRERIGAIVAAHLGEEAAGHAVELIEEFLTRRERGTLATDQLLNAVYLLRHAAGGAGLAHEDLVEIAFRELGTRG